MSKQKSEIIDYLCKRIMTNDIVEAKELVHVSDNLYKGITEIIDYER